MNQIHCGRCGSTLEIDARGASGERTCPICLGALMIMRSRPAPAPAPGNASSGRPYEDTARICPICAEDRDGHAADCPDAPEVMRITRADGIESPAREVDQGSYTAAVALGSWMLLSLLGMPLVFQVNKSDAPLAFFIVLGEAGILVFYAYRSSQEDDSPGGSGGGCLLNLLLMGAAFFGGLFLFVLISCSGTRIGF